MSRSRLALEAANLDALVREDLDLLAASPGPEDALRLARRLRQRGCAALLRHLDLASFQEDLQRAALAWLHVLERRGALRDVDPYWLSRSAGVPYLDALAAGDRILAADIAAKSTPTFTRGMEDEDDFAAYVALAELAAPHPEPARVDAALTAYAAVLGGGSSPRLDALRALHAGDAAGLRDALAALVTGWEVRVEEERATGIGDPYFVNVEAHVCVEALALAQLARWYGIAVEGPLPALPPPVLDLPPPASRPDLWA